jgi:acetyl esterase
MPIDPYARRFLDRLAAINSPGVQTLSVSERREALEQLLIISGTPVAVSRVEDRSLSGPGGPLAARLYTPAEASGDALAGLIYFHGGGFVAGNLESHDAICRALCNASGCRLIAIDYRLAPEHPFPAAIEDGYAAVSWIAAHAAHFGVDPERLAVGGDSAGAMLAAAVCQRVGATQNVHLALQLLLCPLMDYGAQTDSRRSFAQGYFLDQATLDHDCKHYLGERTSRTRVYRRCAPTI